MKKVQKIQKTTKLVKIAPITHIPPAQSVGFMVVRDTREKDRQGWMFDESRFCEGTVIRTLKTGDYTLLGLETLFAIERKKTVAEFARNINEKRFEQELQRLEKFAHPYIICEFTMGDIMKWPVGSGIPYPKQKDIKVSAEFILRRMMEFEVKYKTKFILAGPFGKQVALSLFKRIHEKYSQ